MENESVTLTVTMTYEDYCAFQDRYLKKARNQLTIVVSFVSLMIVLSHPSRTESMFLLFMTPLILFVALGIYFLFPKLVRKKYRAYYDSNKLLRREQTFTITAVGLELKSDTEMSKYTWDDLYAFKETEESFLIYLSKTQCYILPKRCVENDGQTVLLRQHFQKLPPYKEDTSYRRFMFLFVGIFIVFAVILLLLMVLSRLG